MPKPPNPTSNKILLSTFVLSLLVSIAGFSMLLEHNHRIDQVKAACSLNHCIHLAERRIGVIAWGKTVLTVGLAVNAVSGQRHR